MADTTNMIDASVASTVTLAPNLPAQAMRYGMETKGALASKGQLYAGTGSNHAVVLNDMTGSSVTYTIADTVATAAVAADGSTNGYLLVANNAAASGWTLQNDLLNMTSVICDGEVQAIQEDAVVMNTSGFYIRSGEKAIGFLADYAPGTSTPNIQLLANGANIGAINASTLVSSSVNTGNMTVNSNLSVNGLFTASASAMHLSSQANITTTPSEPWKQGDELYFNGNGIMTSAGDGLVVQGQGYGGIDFVGETANVVNVICTQNATCGNIQCSNSLTIGQGKYKPEIAYASSRAADSGYCETATMAANGMPTAFPMKMQWGKTDLPEGNVKTGTIIFPHTTMFSTAPFVFLSVQGTAPSSLYVSASDTQQFTWSSYSAIPTNTTIYWLAIE